MKGKLNLMEANFMASLNLTIKPTVLESPSGILLRKMATTNSQQHI